MYKKRGPKKKKLVPISKRRFMEALEYRNMTIKSLGESLEFSRSESAMGKYLREGGLPEDVLEEVAVFLNVHPDFICGKYDYEKYAKDPTQAEAIHNLITPDKCPYVIKAASDIDLKRYYETLLVAHEIPFSDFLKLEPDERLKFQKEMENSIINVLKKFFSERDPHQFEAININNIDEIELIYKMCGVDYWENPEKFHDTVIDESIVNFEELDDFDKYYNDDPNIITVYDFTGGEMKVSYRKKDE